MTLVIDYDFVPEPSIIAAGLEIAADRMEDFKEAFRRSLNEVLIPSFSYIFESQGGEEPWLPLSGYTLIRREQEGFAPGPILERTGELKRWAISPMVWIIQPQQMEATVPPLYGSDGAEYPAFFQTGTSKMPPRPYWYITEANADAVVEIFSEQVSIIFDTSVPGATVL